jgi:hypothetical protein
MICLLLEPRPTVDPSRMGHQYKKVSCDTASLTLLFNDSKKYKLGHEYRLGIFLVEIVTANQLAYGDSGG